MARGQAPTFAERRARRIAQLRAELDAGLVVEAVPAKAMPSPPLPSPSPSPPIDLREASQVCVQCGRSHSQENRLRLIRPMAEGHSRTEIVEAWPCFYDHGASGYSKLMQDLALLRKRAAK